MPQFPGKMVLYLSTKFGIIKHWTNISWPRWFDLAFWQTSKQVYRKLQYRQKIFREFQGLSHFPRKMILYSLTKFVIRKTWTNIQWLRVFDLGFWQTSKQVFRKLQYRKKVFGEIKGLSRFPRKMVFYSSTKFGIIKPWTNIQSLRRSNLGFWQTSKQIYRKLQYRKKVFGEFKVCLAFLEKWFCIRWPILAL